MKTNINRVSATSLLVAFLFTFPIASEKPLTGTWCVRGEGLVISFTSKDSLMVSSKRDETMAGYGRYVKQDSTLVVTIANEEQIVEMRYRYKWKNDSLIRAKILSITVNGDSINHPKRWLRMRQCDPETFDFDDTTEADDEADNE